MVAELVEHFHVRVIDLEQLIGVNGRRQTVLFDHGRHRGDASNVGVRLAVLSGALNHVQHAEGTKHVLQIKLAHLFLCERLATP